MAYLRKIRFSGKSSILENTNVNNFVTYCATYYIYCSKFRFINIQYKVSYMS